MDSCKRCDSEIIDSRCDDYTCPFSDHDQTCPVGWVGYPDTDDDPECTCL